MPEQIAVKFKFRKNNCEGVLFPSVETGWLLWGGGGVMNSFNERFIHGKTHRGDRRCLMNYHDLKFLLLPFDRGFACTFQ